MKKSQILKYAFILVSGLSVLSCSNKKSGFGTTDPSSPVVTEQDLKTCSTSSYNSNGTFKSDIFVCTEKTSTQSFSKCQNVINFNSSNCTYNMDMLGLESSSVSGTAVVIDTSSGRYGINSESTYLSMQDSALNTSKMILKVSEKKQINGLYFLKTFMLSDLKNENKISYERTN